MIALLRLFLLICTFRSSLSLDCFHCGENTNVDIDDFIEIIMRRHPMKLVAKLQPNKCNSSNLENLKPKTCLGPCVFAKFKASEEGT